MAQQKNTPISHQAQMLATYVDKNFSSNEQFALEKGIFVEKLDALMKLDCVWTDGKIYIRATQTNLVFELTDKSKAILLIDHISSQYEGDIDAFATELGESVTFIENAAIESAMWLEGEIIRPIFTARVWKAISLKHFVDDQYNANSTGFARAYSLTQQQVHRWVNKDCVWCCGEVFMRRTFINANSVLPSSMEAISLEDHIKSHYSENYRKFAQVHQIRDQQLERYVEYDALWINGDIYKNQSKFEVQGITANPSKAAKRPRSESVISKKKG
jgi:hypothetical protein